MIRLPDPPNLPQAFTLEEVKLQLRVDHDDEDSLIGGLSAAAISWCEDYTGRALTPQRWRVTLSPERWRGWAWPVELPRPPLVSVDQIRAVWVDGPTSIIDPTRFVVTEDEPAEIGLALGTLLPYEIQELRVDITCGTTAVPPRVRQAVMMIISHWYENRTAATLSNADLREPPFGVSAMLDTMRVMRL